LDAKGKKKGELGGLKHKEEMICVYEGRWGLAVIGRKGARKHGWSGSTKCRDIL